jgi:hypothetical protein
MEPGTEFIEMAELQGLFPLLTAAGCPPDGLTNHLQPGERLKTSTVSGRAWHFAPASECRLTSTDRGGHDHRALKPS